MSRIWDHYLREGQLGKATCKYCNVKFALPRGGSTGNHWCHLKKAHPEVLATQSIPEVGIVPKATHNSLFQAPKSLLNRRLVEFICSTGIPLNCLDNPSFKSFCRTLNSPLSRNC